MDGLPGLWCLFGLAAPIVHQRGLRAAKVR
jgi:hypothetical protein